MKQKTDDIGQLIRLNRVLELIPVAKSTWWGGVRAGIYPQPVKLGDRITCWRLEEIRNWPAKASERAKCEKLRR